VFGATPIVDNITDSVGRGDDVRDNLMYYANTSSRRLSDGQATVLRRSLWVRPAP
jgi:hypothetical protein